MFLPHVQKVIDEAKTLNGLVYQLDYIFSRLPSICMDNAMKFGPEQLQHWGLMLGLIEENEIKPEPIKIIKKLIRRPINDEKSSSDSGRAIERVERTESRQGPDSEPTSKRKIGFFFGKG